MLPNNERETMESVLCKLAEYVKVETKFFLESCNDMTNEIQQFINSDYQVNAKNRDNSNLDGVESAINEINKSTRQKFPQLLLVKIKKYTRLILVNELVSHFNEANTEIPEWLQSESNDLIKYWRGNIEESKNIALTTLAFQTIFKVANETEKTLIIEILKSAISNDEKYPYLSRINALPIFCNLLRTAKKTEENITWVRTTYNMQMQEWERKSNLFTCHDSYNPYTLMWFAFALCIYTDYQMPFIAKFINDLLASFTDLTSCGRLLATAAALYWMLAILCNHRLNLQQPKPLSSVFAEQAPSQTEERDATLEVMQTTGLFAHDSNETNQTQELEIVIQNT